MPVTPPTDKTPRHLRLSQPSRWIAEHAPLVRPGGRVLDVAAGGGRHVRFFASLGHPVTAVDVNIEPLRPLAERLGAEVIEADLEDASHWPLTGRSFDAVVVCNYLFRPRFDDLCAALASNGVLLYETFQCGNEVYGKPRNPDHLLGAGELLELVRGRLQVVAYQAGRIEGEHGPAVKQMLAAVNNLNADGSAPEAKPLP